MSITSVGASFGYIDPSAAAGPARAVTADSDANDAPSPASTAPAADSGDAGANQKQPPQATSQTSSPKFAPETAAALIVTQATASLH